MRNITTFQNWQIKLTIIQIIILLLAFLGAFYVGLKQNEINRNLLNLNYIPSLEITYNHA